MKERSELVGRLTLNANVAYWWLSFTVKQSELAQAMVFYVHRVQL